MRFSIRAILLTVVLGTVAWSSAYSSAATVRVVSATESKVTLEIDIGEAVFEPSRHIEGYETFEIGGFGSFSVAGEPLIPGRDYLVALPPEGAASMTYVVLQTRSLGPHRLEPVPFPDISRDDEGMLSSSAEYRVDPAIYDAGASVIAVSMQPEGRLRNQRVLPIRVQPVSYDPATGETALAALIRIDIAISVPAGRGVAGGRLPVQETAVWERIYSRLLVNPEQARGWRSKPVPGLKDARSSTRVLEATAGPLVKLAVNESGLHKVTASAVLGSGFLSGTPIAQLHLFQRAYDDSATIVDVAFKVVEDTGGVSGMFDGSDYLVFYGQELRVDTLRNDPVEKFTEQNIYWLGDSGGPQMAAKALVAGTVSADTATAMFPVTLYSERDLWFSERTPPMDVTTSSAMREFNYYNDPVVTSLSVPFTLGPVRAGTTFELKARFLGGFQFIGQDDNRPFTVEILNSNGATPLVDGMVVRSRTANYTSGAVSSDFLTQGTNTLRLRPILQPAGREGLEALLDWFTVEYEAPFRAAGNTLAFNTGTMTGSQNITVTGLGRDDVALFDVTDPLVPLECTLDSSHFTDLGNGQHALSFQINITTPRRFIMIPLDQIKEISGSDVIEDEPSTLIGHQLENSGVDILVVSHKDYLGEIQRWVDYRKAQGYRVLVANVDDVYDEFNGGVNNARAIRDFVRHFFTNSNAGFLLLVGDSSEDAKSIHVDSAPNFVPTESFTEHVQSIVFNEDEVVTTDKYYVMLGKDIIYDPTAVFPADFYPDLIVGRFPAGTVEELRIMIDKSIAFEKPDADDFWRRRMLRVADDAWSGGFTTCFSSAELDFEVAEEVAAVKTESSMPGGYDVVRFYLQDRISHPPSGCVSAFAQQQLTRMNATPVLQAEIAQGATIISFQAHMNRFQICHEYLFTSLFTVGRDWLNMGNTGRPSIVFGMGCHLSDYAIHRELVRTARNGPNGDCLSELMLLEDNKGAVNTYGSTGFEYLRENKNYTGVIADVFYNDPPVGATLPSGDSQVRWIMGELMTTSEIENLLRFGNLFGSGMGARGQAKRYHVLGDPVLRIDGGPPRFDVTVNGQPVQSGDHLLAANGDSVRVRGVITDEVAIEKLTLEIDGVDVTNQMTQTALVDTNLDAARQYEVTFETDILPKTYDIVIRAHQAADTSAGDYHMIAEFVLRVELDVSLSINGRPTVDGDLVPTTGDYLFELTSPVFIDPSLIHVQIDGTDVPALDLSHPSPDDSTTWLIGFSQTLSTGPHTVSLDPGAFEFDLSVGSSAGVRDLIAFPNPFADETYFVYSNDLQISEGAIDIFTASGKKVAHLDIPASARTVGQNAVRWDGTTWDGGRVANGVYLFVMSIDQGGQTTTERGKLVKVQ